MTPHGLVRVWADKGERLQRAGSHSKRSYRNLDVPNDVVLADPVPVKYSNLQPQAVQVGGVHKVCGIDLEVKVLVPLWGVGCFDDL